MVVKNLPVMQETPVQGVVCLLLGWYTVGGGWILQGGLWAGWPTCSGLPGIFPFLKLKVPCPGKPSSVPGILGQLVITETGRKPWNGSLGTCIRLRYVVSSATVMSVSYLWTCCLEEFTACCFVSVCPLSGKIHNRMRQDEIAVCSWDYFGANVTEWGTL